MDRTPLACEPGGNRSWFVDAVGNDRLTFVVCPSGEFLMGSPTTETDRDNDERIHRVILSHPFALGVHEVTRNQFERYQRATGTDPKRSDADPSSPAVGVTWYNAVSYCRWLTNQFGLAESDQCYDDPVALERTRMDSRRTGRFTLRGGGTGCRRRPSGNSLAARERSHHSALAVTADCFRSMAGSKIIPVAIQAAGAG